MKNLGKLLKNEKKENTKLGKALANNGGPIDYSALADEINDLRPKLLSSLKRMNISDLTAKSIIDNTKKSPARSFASAGERY